MRKTNLYFITFLVALLLLPAILFAQKKELLAILPFTGGEVTDGDFIASNLSREPILRSSFNNNIKPITRANIATLKFEQHFQSKSGFTDPDTIFDLGIALEVSHVVAGYITKLGNQKLVLVSIMDVESLQQIAGYYKQYSTIEEIKKFIPEMASQLAKAVMRDTKNLPGLSVPPFNISPEVDQNSAMVLAQILSCDLANAGKYAVLPRTDSLDKVKEELKRQYDDGTTDLERVERFGLGRNAQYVLAGSVEKLGKNLTQFATDILTIDGVLYDTAPPEEYKDFAEGFTLIPKLAAKLSSPTITPPPKAETPSVDLKPLPGKEPKPKNDYNLFWGIGTSVGSSFTTPWAIGSIQLDISPFSYTILELGCDFGIIHGYDRKDIEYYSLYPFGHLVFTPNIKKYESRKPFILYVGIGGGAMISSYKTATEDNSFTTPAADLTAGFYIGQGHPCLHISYTLRATFSAFNHKAAIGYTYRF